MPVDDNPSPPPLGLLHLLMCVVLFRSEASPSPTVSPCAPPDRNGKRRFLATCRRWAAPAISRQAGEAEGDQGVPPSCGEYRGW